MTFENDGIYRLHNNGPKDFVGEYEFKKYLIAAGSDAWLPAGCVVCWLGHPNAPTSRNGKPSEERYTEVRRIRSIWGAYDDDVVWEENKPTLEVFDNEGTKVFTPCDDPLGTYGVSEGFIIPGPEEAWAQVDKLEAQIAALRAQLTRPEAQGSLATSTVAVQEPTMPDDEPPTKPPVDKSSRVRVS